MMTASDRIQHKCEAGHPSLLDVNNRWRILIFFLNNPHVLRSADSYYVLRRADSYYVLRRADSYYVLRCADSYYVLRCADSYYVDLWCYSKIMRVLTQQRLLTSGWHRIFRHFWSEHLIVQTLSLIKNLWGIIKNAVEQKISWILLFAKKVSLNFGSMLYRLRHVILLKTRRAVLARAGTMEKIK